MALPLVGPKQVGEVRLAPQLRSRLRRRAFGLARAEYRPAIAADRAALQSVRHQRRTDVRSVAGATNLAEQAITGATKALRKSGLPGSYRGQVAQALSTRAADVASSAPALASAVRQGYASPIASAKGAILADRAQLQKTGADTLYSELSKARTQGRAFIARKATQAKKGKTHARNVQATQRIAHQDLAVASNILTSYGLKGVLGTAANDQTWAAFTQYLGTQLGGTAPHARAIRVVKHIRQGPILAGLISNAITAGSFQAPTPKPPKKK